MGSFDGHIQVVGANADPKTLVRLFNYNCSVDPICGVGDFFYDPKAFHLIEFLLKSVLEGYRHASSWYCFWFSSFFQRNVALSFELTNTLEEVLEFFDKWS